MRQVTLAEAESNFTELVAEAERGEVIEIEKQGKVVARLVAASISPKKPLDIDGLRAHLATMPVQDESAGDFIRKMRDEDRY